MTYKKKTKAPANTVLSEIRSKLAEEIVMKLPFDRRQTELEN